MHTRGGHTHARARVGERGREEGKGRGKTHTFSMSACFFFFFHTDVEKLRCSGWTRTPRRAFLPLLTMDSDDDAPPDLVPLDAAPQPPARAPRPQHARTREGRPPVPVTLITGALVRV